MLGFPFRPVGTVGLLAVGLLACFSAPSQAACFPSGCRQNGLVFSEASRNFEITNITGTGTANNPFVIYQDVSGLDISLAIDNLNNAQQHSQFRRPGFAISIVSRNLTGAFWRFYDHELQEVSGQASHENDGLSFGQGIPAARPYTSSHYATADEVTDVRDFINFYGGQGVQPGESVRFNYFVTDTIPNQRFFIRQRPDFRTNTVPTSVLTSIAPPAPAAPPAPVAPSAPPVAPPEPVAPPAPVAPVAAQVTVTPIAPPQLLQLSTSQAIPEPTTSLMGSAIVLLGMWCKRRGNR